MSGLSSRLLASLPGILLLTQAAAGAPPASADLLPNTTKQHLSVAMPQFTANWKRTQFAQAGDDPKLKPFIDDLSRQLTDPFGLGVGRDHLSAAAGGEVSWALVRPAADQVAHVFTLDATGKGDQVKALLDRMTSHLKRQGYTSTKQPGDDGVTVHERTADGGKQSRVVHVLKKDLLIVSDSVAVLNGILGRWSDGAKDSLARLPAYREVRARSHAQAKENPDLFWFVEPLGWAEALRIAQSRQRPKGPDLLKILQDEGFEAFQGIGGVVGFGVGNYELVHHTAVYAPLPYQKSMRMFRFLASTDFTPPDWIPGDVAFHLTAYLDVQNCFATMGSLVDAFLEDPGAYQAMIKRVRDGRDGPMIDLPREVIARLGRRVTVVRDAESPPHFHADRVLWAFDTPREKELAQVVKRFMQNDPEVKRRTFQDQYVIWESIGMQQPVPAVKGGIRRDTAPNGVVAVARGHLFVSSHRELLEKVLATSGSPLPRRDDWVRVDRELAKPRPEESMRAFARLDELFRTAHEFLRHDQLAEAPSLPAQLLALVLDSGPDHKLGKKLPAFKAVSPYLGPAGISVTNQKDGWLAVGFVLKK